MRTEATETEDGLWVVRLFDSAGNVVIEQYERTRLDAMATLGYLESTADTIGELLAIPTL